MANWTGQGFQERDGGDEKAEWREGQRMEVRDIRSAADLTNYVAPKWMFYISLTPKLSQRTISDCVNVTLVFELSETWFFFALHHIAVCETLAGRKGRQTDVWEENEGKRKQKRLEKVKSVQTNLPEPCDQLISTYALWLHRCQHSLSHIRWSLPIFNPFSRCAPGW